MMDRPWTTRRLAEPAYTFVVPWDSTTETRCLIDMGGTMFEVRRLADADFRAYYRGGKAIATAGSFKTLLKKLDRWPIVI